MTIAANVSLDAQCKTCNGAPVKLIQGTFPHDVDHWMCIKCDSTYDISEYGHNDQAEEREQ